MSPGVAGGSGVQAQPVGAPVPGWTPRPVPAGVVLTGRTCVLEPLSSAHVGGLVEAWAGTDDAHWTYLSMERPDGVDAVGALVDSMVATPGWLTFAVLVDGRAAGVMSLMRIDPANGSIEIGGVNFGAPLMRTVASTEAQRLLMGHLFDGLVYRRLEWKCDALNAGSRRAAQRLGYTFEGVFRQAMVTKGRNRDTAWFSLLDGEWPAVRERLDTWLDPANFDAEGRQRHRLLG
ncbi:GNAT family protein [Ornithinibacter sp.]|uniref:GNAT family N-acetyltransferase n=1 Tax=Ornithinibacter sp. TaxID=2862748 RepID=UPI002C51F48F|nr:GNAT family protein [Ornithinibacter sp.]HRA27856.1 GNAT family protein [Ornithinibacter sp.]